MDLAHAGRRRLGRLRASAKVRISRNSFTNRFIRSELRKFSSLCVVDVGHHKGDWARTFFQLQCPRGAKVHLIGIDPIDYGTNICDRFYQNAISTITGSREFHVYDEPGCSSLLELQTEHRVSEPSEDGWYCAYNIAEIETREVYAISLQTVLNESNFDLIHFVKVDAQGNDLDVLQSAGKRLQDVLFVQLETSVARNAQQLMYEGQTVLAHDVAWLGESGFEPILIDDHSRFAPPEADVVLINRILSDKKWKPVGHSRRRDSTAKTLGD